MSNTSLKHGFFTGLGYIGAFLAVLIVLGMLYLFVLIPATSEPYCPQTFPGEYYNPEQGICMAPSGYCFRPGYCNGVTPDYNTKPVMRSPFQFWLQP